VTALTRAVVPPAQGNNQRQSKAYALLLVCILMLASFPGALIGLAIALVVWRATRPNLLTRWLFAGLSAATIPAVQPGAHLVWSWSLISGSDATPGTVIASMPAEVLSGPLILVAWQLGLAYRQDTIHAEEWRRFNQLLHRKRSLERTPSLLEAPAHPAGQIRLGMTVESRRPLDLGLDDIAHHIFVPGASGSGKTTTLVRLADGALANGYGVVVVDCKGVGLGAEAHTLASLHNVPFTVVDPYDDATLGYDPCTGDPATVANKLVGAFSFSEEAEIYKHVAMEIIPVLCRAMAAAGVEITLTSIYQALARGGLARLGRTHGAEKWRDRLEELESAGGVGSAGYLGLQKRFGALIEGTFGPLFHQRPAMQWAHATASPRVTYLSLSATAAGEDVQLFGRVITQDLKQVCDQRMRAIARGTNPTPVLVIYDEFAALREAQQVVDLLLQARQARAIIVVATQFLPEEISIRKPVLSAGALIVHRVEAEDAEVLAAQFGTHKTTNVTAQVEYDEGLSHKGSVRWVEEYNVHPNDLKALPVGVAAVYARRSRLQDLVRVYRTI
jgi:Type IV secretion-system coupling protein DNA-binding domain